MVSRVAHNFGENSKMILCRRYLQKGEEYETCERCGERHESIEAMLERVSFGNSAYYDLMARLDFLPNSPTLFNAGTGRGTFSACFVFHVPDTMDGIMSTATKAALVQKWGGGVGYAFSNLREKGAPIATTHGRACGPVAVLKLYNELATMITQGGKRAGAQMGILAVEHPDIKEFIHVKDENPDALSTFNISVALSDDFMRRLEDGDVDALALWDEMCASAWKTGDPGCYFIDNAERANPTPWLGRLLATNPCGEIPLLSDEPCNLGSINLGNFVNEWGVDWPRLEDVARMATNFLDDILDNNQFPHPDIDHMARYTRKLGLGVMGWADMLALLHIPYDSERAIELGDEVMGRINTWAEAESRSLTLQKGPNPAFFDYHRNDDDFANNLAYALPRNATRTAIAPTGTISILAGASSGIEPHFALEWTRYMEQAGERIPIQERIPVMESLNGFTPRVSHEIGWEWHVRHQAAFQKHADLAVSKTINMPNSASKEDIVSAYKLMYALGCKGGTIYRDGCRDKQVLEVKDAVTRPREDFQGSATPSSTEGSNSGHPVRRKLPRERSAVNTRFDIGGMEGYAMAGLYEEGTPGELFIHVSKEGSTVAGLMDTVAVLTSYCLQYGVPVDVISRKLSGVRFEPSGFTGNPEIPSATSVVDYIFRWLALRFGAQPLHKSSEGILCPECGVAMAQEEGCLKCYQCGHSEC